MGYISKVIKIGKVESENLNKISMEHGVWSMGRGEMTKIKDYSLLY